VSKTLQSARHPRADPPYAVAVAPVDLTSARELLEAIVAAFSVLGGGMAYFSGYNAAQALAQAQLPEVVAHRVNQGLGRGFAICWLPAVLALFVMVMG
jgi:hypothetical protein